VDIVKVRQSVSVGPPTEEHWFYVMRATHRRRQTGRRCDPDASRATERSEGASPTERSEGGSDTLAQPAVPESPRQGRKPSESGHPARIHRPTPTPKKPKKYGSLYWERGVGGPPRGRGGGQGHGPLPHGRWWGHYLQATSYPTVGGGGHGHRATAGSGVDPRGALRHRHGLGASGSIPWPSGVHPDRDGGRVRTGGGIFSTDSAYLIS